MPKTYWEDTNGMQIKVTPPLSFKKNRESMKKVEVEVARLKGGRKKKV